MIFVNRPFLRIFYLVLIRIFLPLYAFVLLILLWEYSVSGNDQMLMPVFKSAGNILLLSIFFTVPYHIHLFIRFFGEDKFELYKNKLFLMLGFHLLTVYLCWQVYFYLRIGVDLFDSRYIQKKTSPDGKQTAYLYEKGLGDECQIFLRPQYRLILKKAPGGAGLSCSSKHRQILLWSADSQRVGIYHPDYTLYDVPSTPVYLFPPRN
ncbi:hypothetical protein K1X76_11625 [bacterium]|nr:hypothetical protein [bacterium]